MARVRVHQSILLAFASALIVVVFFPSRAQALPTNLRVDLFETHNDTKEAALIHGPFKMASPISRQFGKTERIAIKKGVGTIEIYSILHDRSIKDLCKCNRVILLSSENRGISIQVLKTRRRYRGRLVFSQVGAGMKIVNEVPIRDYVASVVGSEAPTHCPMEALKAFAVLTLMIVDRKGEGEVIGDSTKEEAYKGAEYATAEVESAVAGVFSKRLVFQGSPIKPYYHSTCAGGTSSGVDIFGKDAVGLTYLRHVDCFYCKQSPFWKHTVATISATTLKKIFGSKTLPVIEKKDETDRPISLKLSDNAHLSGYEAWLKLGRALGWGAVPGTRYDFEPSSKNVLDLVNITSSGAGHGVGLCQWGAVGLANQGKSAEEILSFYFPGTKLVSVAVKPGL